MALRNAHLSPRPQQNNQKTIHLCSERIAVRVRSGGGFFLLSLALPARALVATETPIMITT